MSRTVCAHDGRHVDPSRVVVISPATTTMPVLASVSQATRAFGSCARMASRMASETCVAKLVRMPFGDGLGRELITAILAPMSGCVQQRVGRVARPEIARSLLHRPRGLSALAPWGRYGGPEGRAFQAEPLDFAPLQKGELHGRTHLALRGLVDGSGEMRVRRGRR